MEFKNLGKNILYLLCHELELRRECGPLEVDRVYEAFADLPGDVIAGSIASLADRGLLQPVEKGRKVQITAEGLSEIRGFVPERLRHTCKAPEDCAEPSAGEGGGAAD